MFEILKTKLETLGTDAWELTELQEKRWEFYFIRHELDQNRSVNTRTYEVKVYKSIEGGKFIGSASGEISPALSEGEIDKTLSELLSRAGLVKNKPYSITSKPVSAELETMEIDVSTISESFLEAVRSVEETETEDINSYELFVSEKKKRLLLRECSCTLKRGMTGGDEEVDYEFCVSFAGVSGDVQAFL